MADMDDSLRRTIERHRQATTSVRNGDATAFLDELSSHDPVTLFPASQPARTGWKKVSDAIRRVASVYSGSGVVDFDVVAAGLSGDLAYVVGYEEASSSVAGGAQEILTLRVTQVYRREDGEWKLAHRHADPGPGSSPADRLGQAMRDSPRS